MNQFALFINVIVMGHGIYKQFKNHKNNILYRRTVDMMTDDEFIQALHNAVNARYDDLPIYLRDVDDDDKKWNGIITQSFIYQNNLNSKPTVLSKEQFEKYIEDNNIKKEDILARSTHDIEYTDIISKEKIKISTNQIYQLIKYGDNTYIGGKHGGGNFGYGLYMSKNGGKNTGYGTSTMIGVLSPKAKVIGITELRRQFVNDNTVNTKLIRELIGGPGNNDAMTIYALRKGYNVIKDDISYNSPFRNIIDRSAMILQKENI